MYDLIIRTLQKGGIHCHNRTIPGNRKAGGKSNGVTLCDTHVEELVWQSILQEFQARTGSHGCCDTNHTLIFFGQMDQGLAEGLCVTYGSGSTIYLLSGLDGKGCCSMETVRSVLRRGVALPFHSFHMEQNGRVNGWRTAKVGPQRRDIVPVQHPQIGEAQLFKEHSRRESRLDPVFELLSDRVKSLSYAREFLDALLQVMANPGERRI